MYHFFMTLPDVTRLFAVVIALMTIFCHIRYSNVDFHYGPIVLTMMGIFGCFIGIALGLLNFDTADIQGSVPSLLSGIKTSFWASVFGVGGALSIKLRYQLIGGPRTKSVGTARGATVDDLANLLRSLHQSLAGSEDSTLLSQTKLLRQEGVDGFKSLKSSLDNYMEKMADNNSKALIDALQSVIRDFNAKINEQFGDNFKRLNAAVENILIWQESYRKQMQEMIEQQERTTANMTIAVERYSEILQRTAGFSKAAADLAALIEALDAQRQHLTAALSHLGSLLKAAGDGVPRLEEKIVEMTRQIESGVRANNDQLATTLRAVAQQVQGSHTEMQKLLTESAENIHRQVSGNIRELSEKTKEQVVALDAALSEELTKSIGTLGQHLTALSRHFADDYRPLTEQLRRVLEFARA